MYRPISLGIPFNQHDFMNFWDQRFARPDHKYGTEPNAWGLAHVARWIGQRV
jgi:hypothetical protein